MNEIDKVLESNEKVLWSGAPKYSAYMTAILSVAIIVAAIVIVIVILATQTSFPKIYGYIIAAVLFLIILIFGQLSYRVTYYAITNKRAIIQKGIIGRDFRSVDYDKIQNASVNVGLIGVIFKVGNVNMFTGEMESVGSGQNTRIRPKYDSFTYVQAPYDALKIIEQYTSKRKANLYGGTDS